ncbi:YcbK family protein [Eubacterium maltosivorans]|uniref:Peptidase M15 n=1 Tax=Eubacterium maltosivorans TaxID=2041044 RepID=A0A4P9CCS0_EUBML|nr:D-Ala-D-Ala carboxypeptidase family metallohydrolase [Eubacterium maltosivorans]QCT72675.1 peptidase M15 [Eubacterium maltosivorans]
MKTVKKRTVLLLLAVLTAAGILYFALELSWAPMRQNPPPSQTEEAPKPETPAPEAPAPEAPEPETPAQPQSGVLEQQPLMVSEHFARDEYRCDCQGSCDGFPAEPDPELVRRVEALRLAVDAPVIITSGVRCEKRNEEVGGVPWSFHKRGAAADLYSPGVPVGTLAALAKDCGLNILPYYRDGYVHVEI